MDLLKFIAFYGLVCVTPLILAALIGSLCILDLNNRARVFWSVVYVIWCALWIWFWTAFTTRARPYEWYEYLFVGGFWLTPLLGAVVIISAHRASKRESNLRGFEITPISGEEGNDQSK